MSKDDEVGGAELRGEVLLEVSDDPQRTATLPQPELKVTAAERRRVSGYRDSEKVETKADAVEKRV